MTRHESLPGRKSPDQLTLEQREKLNRSVKAIEDTVRVWLAGNSKKTEQPLTEAELTSQVFQRIANIVHGRSGSSQLLADDNRQDASKLNCFQKNRGSALVEAFEDAGATIDPVVQDSWYTERVTGIEDWLKNHGASFGFVSLVRQDRGEIGGLRVHLHLMAGFPVPLSVLQAALLDAAANHGADIRSDEERKADAAAEQADQQRAHETRNQEIAQQFGPIIDHLRAQGARITALEGNTGSDGQVSCRFYPSERPDDEFILTKDLRTNNISVRPGHVSSGDYAPPDWLRLDTFRPTQRATFDRLFQSINSVLPALRMTDDAALLARISPQLLIAGQVSEGVRRNAVRTITDEQIAEWTPQLQSVEAVLLEAARQVSERAAEKVAQEKIARERQEWINEQPRTIRILNRDREGWVSETEIPIDPRWENISCQFQVVMMEDVGRGSYPLDDDHYRAVAKAFVNARGRVGGRDDRHFVLQRGPAVVEQERVLQQQLKEKSRAAVEIKKNIPINPGDELVLDRDGKINTRYTLSVVDKDVPDKKSAILVIHDAYNQPDIAELREQHGAVIEGQLVNLRSEYEVYQQAYGDELANLEAQIPELQAQLLSYTQTAMVDVRIQAYPPGSSRQVALTAELGVDADNKPNSRTVSIVLDDGTVLGEDGKPVLGITAPRTAVEATTTIPKSEPVLRLQPEAPVEPPATPEQRAAAQHQSIFFGLLVDQLKVQLSKKGAAAQTLVKRLDGIPRRLIQLDTLIADQKSSANAIDAQVRAIQSNLQDGVRQSARQLFSGQFNADWLQLIFESYQSIPAIIDQNPDAADFITEELTTRQGLIETLQIRVFAETLQCIEAGVRPDVVGGLQSVLSTI